MKSAELFEKLKGMPEEAAKIQAECKTQDEVYEALKALGLTDSKEQFLAAVKENIISAGVVSEEELDSALAAGDGLSALMKADEEIGAGFVSGLVFGANTVVKLRNKFK